uniref:uncharacterized protein DDB_G0283697 n=1 Tax=Erigeron canadensis TaxID=72917 RepID=UPI001CB9818F|nr:uncharacterized protein DDB_G0283697 [Erigeron canadensis]XP_043616712.1 uncharacterized protein DDB_G0283697 [Erigeron canadensis]
MYFYLFIYLFEYYRSICFIDSWKNLYKQGKRNKKKNHSFFGVGSAAARMLDGLLGRSGFSSKCKSLVKPTRTRIEALRKRAEAKQRFSKEDLVKLLANGLDVNAFGRTEEFIAGLDLLSCYTFIDQSCEYILKQLSVMSKLGQCPEECRETVASLMFAAARFSDLPELRDLRDVFQERYGNGLECYVNQAFVEKLASKPPVVEKKIKLLQDIAAEFSIQWDSKGFKQRMDKPTTVAQEQPKKPGAVGATDDKFRPPNANNFFRENDQRSKKRTEHAEERLIMHNDGNVNIRRKEGFDKPPIKTEECSKERIERIYEGSLSKNAMNGNVRRNEELNIPFVRREEKCFKERIPHDENGIGNVRRKEDQDIPFAGRDKKRSKERIEHAPYNRNGYENGNGSVRRKEVFEFPFEGRDEKLANKDEGLARRKEVFDFPFVGRDEKHANKDEELSRRKEVFDFPFVGIDEKRANKDEEFANKAKNGGEYFKPRHESDMEKNAHGQFGQHDIPVMVLSLGSSYHDKEREAFDEDRVHRSRKERHRYKQEPVTSREETIESREIDHLKGRSEMKSSRRSRDRRPKNLDNGHVNADPKVEKPDLLDHGKSEGVSNGRKHPDYDDEDALKSAGKVKAEEQIRLKSSLPPPPYVKLNIPPPYSKPHNASKSERVKEEASLRVVDDQHYQNDIPLPKPRSIRRKHCKSSSIHDDIGSSEDAHIVKRISSSRRKEGKGLQILFDDEHYHSHKDEEEKMMDKLLLHYSKKPSAYDIAKLRKKKSRSNTSKSPSPHHISKDEVAEMIVPPMRSLSLPNEHSGESEPKKVYARANSFQPDNQAPHVHPKLPDYDDLAARFAALRGG